jgi:hypothetical protein
VFGLIFCEFQNSKTVDCLSFDRNFVAKNWGYVVYLSKLFDLFVINLKTKVYLNLLRYFNQKLNKITLYIIMKKSDATILALSIFLFFIFFIVDHRECLTIFVKKDKNVQTKLHNTFHCH